MKLTVEELTELLRRKMCGPHQECDAEHACMCRDAAKAVLDLIRERTGDGEFERGKDVGRAIGWDAAKRDTSKSLGTDQ